MVEFGDQELARKIESIRHISVVRSLREIVTELKLSIKYPTYSRLGCMNRAVGKLTGIADMLEAHAADYGVKK